MYTLLLQYVHMKKRITIEIDEQLLAKPKLALGQPTIRPSIEEALRIATEVADREPEDRAARQR
jgi:Arc/MetJ family transcription regulator